MTYAYLQDVPICERMYWRVISELGPEPSAGQLAHLCVKHPDGALRHIDVWESEEATRPAPEPSVHRLNVLHACVIGHEDTWA